MNLVHFIIILQTWIQLVILDIGPIIERGVKSKNKIEILFLRYNIDMLILYLMR